jgi:hypothetical protein
MGAMRGFAAEAWKARSLQRFEALPTDKKMCKGMGEKFRGLAPAEAKSLNLGAFQAGRMDSFEAAATSGAPRASGACGVSPNVWSTQSTERNWAPEGAVVALGGSPCTAVAPTSLHCALTVKGTTLGLRYRLSP